MIFSSGFKATGLALSASSWVWIHLSSCQLAYQEGLPSETGTQKQGHLKLVGGCFAAAERKGAMARQSRSPSSRERYEPLQQLTLELGS